MVVRRRRRRRRSGVCGKRKKEKEREAERGGKERVWETESPGPRVHNKGASVPAPGPAGLRGGWRMKEENEDKEEEEEGPQERALAWDPWPALISRKNRLHIDLGLGSHEETPSTPPPSNPFLLHSPPPQLSRGQLWISNYTSTGAVCLRLPPWTQKYWDGRKKQQRGSEWGTKTCGDFCS